MERCIRDYRFKREEGIGDYWFTQEQDETIEGSQVSIGTLNGLMTCCVIRRVTYK
jgi:hypothetical protein